MPLSARLVESALVNKLGFSGLSYSHTPTLPYCRYTAVHPPSTTSVCPVTMLATSDAR